MVFDDFYNPREQGADVWSLVSRSAKPGADILISNLSPATWYQIKVESHRHKNIITVCALYLTPLPGYLNPIFRSQQRRNAIPLLNNLVNLLMLIVGLCILSYLPESEVRLVNFHSPGSILKYF